MGKVVVRGVWAGEYSERDDRIEGAKWKRLPEPSRSTLPNVSRWAGALGGALGCMKRGVSGSDSSCWWLLGWKSGEPIGGEIGRSRIEGLFLRPAQDANDEREEVLDGRVYAVLMGDGFARRRGDLVELRDGGCMISAPAEGAAEYDWYCWLMGYRVVVGEMGSGGGAMRRCCSSGICWACGERGGSEVSDRG